MKVINVNLKENSYEILIKQDLIKEVVSKIRAIYEGKKLAVITDENVHSIYGMELKKTLSLGGFEPSFIVLEPGEKSKSLDTLNYIYSKLVEFNITRTDMIVAFGGGVVGDVTGFAASTYLRGIPYI
ncbi:MAG TPA: 3-dehydroquinate synthase, partial [Clostridiales bacterium]|nr:3-dehydroquinate synthase [Clostridiales bacterium]